MAASSAAVLFGFIRSEPHQERRSLGRTFMRAGSPVTRPTDRSPFNPRPCRGRTGSHDRGSADHLSGVDVWQALSAFAQSGAPAIAIVLQRLCLVDELEELVDEPIGIGVVR